jgi:hypothetical protein
MKLYGKALLAALGVWSLVFVLAWTDLNLRARQAYADGLKYLDWQEHPERKAAHYDAVLARRQMKLDEEIKAGRLAPDAYMAKSSLLRFERDERVSESSLKYAYVWFQTGCELLSPPRGPWARLSCDRMPGVLGRWKAELKAQRLAHEDSIFE